MNNPFEVINARLSNIEDLLLDIKLGPLPAKSTDQDEQFLNIQQAAELLHLSVPTMYSKVHRNELPYMKRGKRLYFNKSELQAYIKEGRKLTNEELKEQAHEYIKK